MLSLRSQEQESSSAEWSAWSPPGNLVSGHSLTMCNIVCLLPQAQSGLSRMPQSWRVAAHRPWPVQKRLRRVQLLLLFLLYVLVIIYFCYTLQPLVVMTSVPTLCASAVQALVNLIFPLRFSLDFRPFFTIHDSEFKEYTTRTQSP